MLIIYLRLKHSGRSGGGIRWDGIPPLFMFHKLYMHGNVFYVLNKLINYKLYVYKDLNILTIKSPN